MEHCSVSRWTPQDLTDLETVWDLLYGGAIGSQGMGDPVYGLVLLRPLRSSTLPYATNRRAPRSAGE